MRSATATPIGTIDDLEKFVGAEVEASCGSRSTRK